MQLVEELGGEGPRGRAGLEKEPAGGQYDWLSTPLTLWKDHRGMLRVGPEDLGPVWAEIYLRVDLRLLGPWNQHLGRAGGTNQRWASCNLMTL